MMELVRFLREKKFPRIPEDDGKAAEELKRAENIVLRREGKVCGWFGLFWDDGKKWVDTALSCHPTKTEILEVVEKAFSDTKTLYAECETECGKRLFIKCGACHVGGKTYKLNQEKCKYR